MPRTSPTRSLKILVPAKVNLFLRVGNQRRDGYHSIETVFHTVGLWDEIVIKPSVSFGFSAHGLPSPEDRSNLCVRAFDLIREHARSGLNASIRLVKRIPPGAGLGGGSADAAACLAGLDRFWRLGLGQPALTRLASNLGSDVPFFIRGGAALGTGRGNVLRSLRSRLDRWCVILKPAFGVLTRAAYARLDSSRRETTRSGTRPRGQSVVAAITRGRLPGSEVHNDFEPVVSRLYPKIGMILRRMKETGLSPVFMTGSGSAVVGLAGNRGAAKAVARSLGKELKVWGTEARLAPLTMRFVSRP